MPALKSSGNVRRFNFHYADKYTMKCSCENQFVRETGMLMRILNWRTELSIPALWIRGQHK